MKQFFTIMCFLPGILFAQKTGTTGKSSVHPIDMRPCNISFNKVYIGNENSIDKVTEYLMTNVRNLKGKSISIKHINRIESKRGIHLAFDQYYEDVRIFRSMIKVNMDQKGNILSVFDNSYRIGAPLSAVFPVEQVAGNYCNQESIDAKSYKQEAVYFLVGKKLLPALRLHVNKSAEINYEVILDAEGKVIYQKNLTLYYCAKPSDSIVTAAVFLPDPLTTAGVTYGAPYVDNSDNDVTELNAERANITMIADYNGGTFTLQSPYVIITEHSIPNVPPVTSATDDFTFTRAQQGFEDVNVYYHIYTFQNHIQNLGFNNLVNYAIECDTHGLNGSDNSMFSPGPPARLTFGEGGVDDAEDADVIIHEYGHAISNSAAPGTNSGSERNALEEANGDYFAVSYSRYLDPYKWENVFSWDGHNPFWPGRMAISTKQYPNDLTGNFYTDAEIWASTIMQIWGDIGRDKTDEILMESMYSYFSNMSMADAAVLYIGADSLLYNGSNYNAICQHFLNRGLVLSCTGNCAPVADFTYIVDLNEVAFQNNSVDAVSYLWGFGDDNTSDLQHPVHSYAGTGQYTIILIAENQCGIDSITKTVEIFPFEENIQLFKTYEFTTLNEDAILDFTIPTTASVIAYNLIGQITWIKELVNESKLIINPASFEPGVYLVRVVTSQNSAVFKLLKL